MENEEDIAEQTRKLRLSLMGKLTLKEDRELLEAVIALSVNQETIESLRAQIADHLEMSLNQAKTISEQAKKIDSLQGKNG